MTLVFFIYSISANVLVSREIKTTISKFQDSAADVSLGSLRTRILCIFVFFCFLFPPCSHLSMRAALKHQGRTSGSVIYWTREVLWDPGQRLGSTLWKTGEIAAAQLHPSTWWTSALWGTQLMNGVFPALTSQTFSDPPYSASLKHPGQRASTARGPVAWSGWQSFSSFTLVTASIPLSSPLRQEVTSLSW